MHCCSYCSVLVGCHKIMCVDGNDHSTTCVGACNFAKTSSIHHPKCQHESVASPLDRQPDLHRNIHRSETSRSLWNQSGGKINKGSKRIHMAKSQYSGSYGIRRFVIGRRYRCVATKHGLQSSDSYLSAKPWIMQICLLRGVISLFELPNPPTGSTCCTSLTRFHPP